ncbi:peptidase M36 [Pyxidicoccus fallax]|uniref:Peptidase M36 n=1 Tax=Pyxidicoccus fallax TaxID=394095 RepID=A0A848LLP3_9BACT|nr:peptidase M36 [Pyxidicoccus fallax]NPC79160.1 peptidase M36 [Pyxidicoccus fallax]
MRSLVTLLGLFAAVMARPASAARDLPTVDAFASSPVPKNAPTARERAKGVHVVHEEPRLGVPTFVWGVKPPDGQKRLRPASPEEAARAVIGEQAGLYRLSRTDAPHVPVSGVHRMREGGSIVTFAQEVDGIPVFRQSLKVLLDKEQQPIAMSGYLSPVASEPRMEKAAPRFVLAPPEAIALAWRDLHGEPLPAVSLKATGRAQGPYSRYALTPGPRLTVLAAPARVRQVFFPLPGTLVPAYYVELQTTPVTETEGDAYSYVISATDGQVLYRHNLTAHQSYTYRVWADAQSPHIPFDGPQGTTATPHPTGLPDGYQSPFVEPNLVTLRNVPFSRNDPWLPEGATQTVGNNVDAYTDFFAPNGFSAGDVRGALSAPGTFAHAYDVLLSPSVTDTQQMAAVTQMFFVTNFLHDWFYDSGFDEASGNAQWDNYGRGGLDGDRFRAEGQDFAGLSNANMSTPSDGDSPRMQMFQYETRGVRVLEIAPDHPLAGRWTVGGAAFGAQQYDITADVVVARDGVPGPMGTDDDACEPLANSFVMRGRIALVGMGGCAPTVKAAHAQAAGAVGVILTFEEIFPIIIGRDPSITIPVVSIHDGMSQQLMAQRPPSARLLREATDRDGTLDNTIVAHEWTHYLSNRLIGDANGLTNNQGRSMGEGWSDFVGLLMIVREGDDQRPSNANFNGVYARAAYANSGGNNQGYYWGNRRYPYSTNLMKNPLTLRHIQNGVRLPAGIPVASGANGASNAQVHSSGQVWATMLWECYAALLRDKQRLTFAQAQQRMRDYLVASLKLTPNAPTFLEARDALLAAAYANDPADFVLFAQAFAKRGAGSRAIAPPRDSPDHVGVVESFDIGKDVVLASVEVLEQPGTTASCDDDGVLDTGETVRVRVTLRNSGIGTLSQTSMTLSSGSPDVSFPEGTTVAFPIMEPLQLATLELPVRLNGPVSTRTIPLTISYGDAEQTVPGNQSRTLQLRVNTDELPGTSAIETAEATNHPWFYGVSGGIPLSWERQSAPDGLNGFFHGPNSDTYGDTSLVSPPLRVANTGAFRFTFQHRFSFETGGGLFYDGAVIELSEDDGLNWVDLGGALSLPYNAVIEPGGGNPLENQTVYGGLSPGHPAFISTSVDLGTAYAGKTVRIRFRVGTDASIGAPGWDVDDIQFEGLVDTPFTSLVDHRGLCIDRMPVADAGPAQTVNERRLVTLSGNGTDPEGAALTWTWTQAAGPAVTLSDVSAQSPTFRAPEVTEDTDLVFELRVSDGTNTSLPSRVTVRVRHISDGNRAPVAVTEAVAPVDEGARATLLGGGSDPDEDALLAFTWTQTGGPAVTLSGASSASPTFTAPPVDSNTELTFQLVVSDGELSSAPATVTVLVRNVSAPPVADAGEDERVRSGGTVTLSGAGSVDPDGTELTYAWTQVDGPSVELVVEGSRATFTAPEVSAKTVLTFRLQVTDIHGESGEDTVSITVAKEPGSGCGCSAGEEGSVPGAVIMLLAALGFALRRPRAMRVPMR